MQPALYPTALHSPALPPPLSKLGCQAYAQARKGGQFHKSLWLSEIRSPRLPAPGPSFWARLFRLGAGSPVNSTQHSHGEHPLRLTWEIGHGAGRCGPGSGRPGCAAAGPQPPAELCAPLGTAAGPGRRCPASGTCLSEPRAAWTQHLEGSETQGLGCRVWGAGPGWDRVPVEGLVASRGRVVLRSGPCRVRMPMPVVLAGTCKPVWGRGSLPQSLCGVASCHRLAYDDQLKAGAATGVVALSDKQTTWCKALHCGYQAGLSQVKIKDDVPAGLTGQAQHQEMAGGAG